MRLSSKAASCPALGILLCCVVCLGLTAGCRRDESGSAAARKDQPANAVPTAATEGASASDANAAGQATPQATMPEIDTTGFTATASGLKYKIVEEGDGPVPTEGQTVRIRYTGKLANGFTFDSSAWRGEPISFPLGKGRVIKGWDEAVALLKAGSKARLVVPPELGYGERGVPPTIPPNATLIFDVELVSAK